MIDSFYFSLLIATVFLFFFLGKNFRLWVLIISGVLFFWYYSPQFLIIVAPGLWLLDGLSQTDKRWLGFLAVMAVITAFAYYKYRFFIFQNLPLFKYEPSPSIVIPLGLSFLSFELIHYLLDRQHGSIKKDNLLKFAAFVLFFPTRPAGPIRRFQQFVPQIKSCSLTAKNLQIGSGRIIKGIFKKIVIADTIVLWQREIFTSFEAVLGTPVWHLWLAIFAFSLRIYFDFSAYSDIAIGSARLLGIVIPENFRLPYLKQNIGQFWKAWHISFYRFVADYIFIPLGGSRYGFMKAVRNTLITLLISGLWHGAAWHFVFWGFYHGILLSLYRSYKQFVEHLLPCFNNKLSYLGSIGLTFVLVSLGWVFFAAPMSLSLVIIKRLLLIE